MPSKRQVSLTLSPAADRAVQKRMKAGSRNKSRVVSQLIERYAGLVRFTNPVLTEDEFEHLVRLTEGWQLDFSTALSLPTVVEGGDVPEDLNVRKAALVIKLQDMGVVGRLAVIELLEMKAD